MEVYTWLAQAQRRKKVLINLTQPMTATHLSQLTALGVDMCSQILSELSAHRIVECLTPKLGKSRIYWVTASGIECQDKLCQENGLPLLERYFLYWEVYGSVCFSHRSTVILTLGRIYRKHRTPAQPSEIRRQARLHDPRLRMSANNVRDVLTYLFAKQIVRRVRVKGNQHWHYEFTELGWTFEHLLQRSNVKVIK